MPLYDKFNDRQFLIGEQLTIKWTNFHTQGKKLSHTDTEAFFNNSQVPIALENAYAINEAASIFPHNDLEVFFSPWRDQFIHYFMMMVII